MKVLKCIPLYGVDIIVCQPVLGVSEKTVITTKICTDNPKMEFGEPNIQQNKQTTITLIIHKCIFNPSMMDFI